MNFFFKENGYYLDNQLISDFYCNNILKIIQKELNSNNIELAFIKSGKYRKHIILPIDNNIKSLINIIYKKYKDLFNELLPDCRLAECACFLSYPNCKNQMWHRDCFNLESENNLISIGVALDDFTEDMGPLEVISQSHLEDNDDLFIPSKKLKLVCKKGSVILWSSKIIHRGGENKSNKERPFFYFTLIGGNKNIPNGPTYAIKEDYKFVKIKDLLSNIK